VRKILFRKATAVALALGLVITPALTGCDNPDSAAAGNAAGAEKVDSSKLGTVSILGDNVRQVDYADVAYRLRGADADQAHLIDVRSVVEYQMGHLKNALNLPLTKIKLASSSELKDIVPAQGELWIYCRSGGRAVEAARTINKAVPGRQIFIVLDDFAAAESHGLEIVQ